MSLSFETPGNTTNQVVEQPLFENAVKHHAGKSEHGVEIVERGMNSSKRQLSYLSCGTGNPIDDCWRCDPNWVNNRKRLADCAIGFGKNAIGGQNGRFYVVTDPNDDDPVNPRPGTLRHAVIQSEPLWIIFQRDMVIQLKEELIMNSYKTIDGRGANVTKREDTPDSVWQHWNWRSQGDLMLNGAFFTASGAAASSTYARASSMGARPSSVVGSITATSGVLTCRKGSSC
ncbi:hypothetical protein KI387_002724, partial [Taxus chinensis]